MYTVYTLYFLSFPVWISILHCFPFSLLSLTCVSLLRGNVPVLPVFHLKSIRFDLSVALVLETGAGDSRWL